MVKKNSSQKQSTELIDVSDTNSETPFISSTHNKFNVKDWEVTSNRDEQTVEILNESHYFEHKKATQFAASVFWVGKYYYFNLFNQFVRPISFIDDIVRITVTDNRFDIFTYDSNYPAESVEATIPLHVLLDVLTNIYVLAENLGFLPENPNNEDSKDSDNDNDSADSDNGDNGDNENTCKCRIDELICDCGTTNNNDRSVLYTNILLILISLLSLGYNGYKVYQSLEQQEY